MIICVLGNPPYVRQEYISDQKPYLQKRYEVYNGVTDLYAYFFELGLRILKPNGRMGYISSATFFKTESGKNLRSFLNENSRIDLIIDFGDIQIFEGVITYPAIFIMDKIKERQDSKLQFLNIASKPEEDIAKLFNESRLSMPQTWLKKDQWSLRSEEYTNLRKKVFSSGEILKNIYGAPLYGLKTGLNKAFIIDKKTKEKLIRSNPQSSVLIEPYLEGKDIFRWHTTMRDIYIILIPNGWTSEKYSTHDESIAWECLYKDHPKICDHLAQFSSQAISRSDQGEFWWELRACSYYDKFKNNKIIWGNLQSKPSFKFDKDSFFINAPCPILSTQDMFLCSLLNSNVLWFALKDIAIIRQGGFLEAKPTYINQLPIPNASASQKSNVENYGK